MWTDTEVKPAKCTIDKIWHKNTMDSSALKESRYLRGNGNLSKIKNKNKWTIWGHKVQKSKQARTEAR